MNPIDFYNSLYLGYREIKRININTTMKSVEIHVNSIPRIRDKSGFWNYYNDEYIEDGVIIIENVVK